MMPEKSALGGASLGIVQERLGTGFHQTGELHSAQRESLQHTHLHILAILQ